jgi:hypothetical protein
MEENFTVHSIGSGAGLRAAILMIGAGSDAPQMKRAGSRNLIEREREKERERRA